MDAAVYREMRSVEDSHWWFSGLRRLVLDAVVPRLAGRVDVRVLDAGCGTGGTMAALRVVTGGLVVGVDASPLATAATRDRRAGCVLQASIEALPFATSSFDVVSCLDVLYVAGVDDRCGLRELHRVLRPCGTLALNLPAFEWLRGAHDVAVHTERRYTRAGVAALLDGAGFTTERLTYWNAALVPVLATWRPLTRLLRFGSRARSDLVLPPAPINAALRRLLAGEIRASRRLRLPFGSSVFAVAMKRG